MRSLLIIVFVVACLSCKAQSYTGSVQGNFVVYSMQSLTVTALGGLITFSSPNDYLNGVISKNYASVSVKSNASWILNFAAQSTYFTALSRNASTDMPATVLGVRKAGGSSFKTLSTQAQKLESGGRGSSGEHHEFNIDVNFNPGFKYSGGLYSIGIVYTLTKQ